MFSRVNTPTCALTVQAAHAAARTSPARRIVAFTDRSRGEIVSRRREFCDVAESKEKTPVHRDERTGEYHVTLTVEGRAGTPRCTALREVLLK